ncbi:MULTISPECIES: FtsW/RodA/SpoVE family cell cycle protein [unclassified Gemella]|uniref:FtsW/RodA/SpoVE family cell cycle protein n=1 Tax=unclassified Gemella TaxID=2624949 RepID=UPI001C05DBEA|nr:MULTISPECIES: FtsW/RodA/SpoVE family cell cycle protein [unclassified Gemella]MBU0278300.1 FtsW/RodA/SpoVE family cell cycle protein [Gemella sp. zg-1178]QWQ38194.1 FtsW/RodA/SpoVE family cell cycle protein [Gemella sp. zg-570]
MKKFILEKSNISLLILYFLLSFISISSIFFAEYINEKTPTLFLKQLVFYIVSFFLIYLIQKISISTYEKMSILFYLFTTVILVLLIFAPESIAPTINGAKAWFNFEILTIQPSEFAKISTLAILSYLIIQEHFKKISDIAKLLELGIIISIPLILIIKENDLGNGLYFIFLFLALVFLVCSRSKTLFIIYSSILGFIASIILLAIYFPTFLSNIGIKPYQLKRLLSWLRPEDFTYNFSYQITQVLNEMSTAGLYGSFSKNINYIDEQFNDFIFSVIAKIYGFAGATIFIFIYFIFLYKIIRISKKCQHGNFSYYFILLTVFSFSFQFIINTYSSTGLIPVIGVSLPFISYGGSSLIANSILFGIILKINNTIYKELAEDEENEEYIDY